MPLTQIFPPTLISARVGPAVKRWPVGAEAIRFVLDDALFTDPALSVTVLMQMSWDGKLTWPKQDLNTWRGGAKSRFGASPSVELGPYRFAAEGIPEGVIVNPSHVRFFAEPGPGSGPVTVGLLAEITEE